MDIAGCPRAQDTQDMLGLQVDMVWVGWSQVDTAGLVAAQDAHAGLNMEVDNSVDGPYLQIWALSRD